MISWRVFPVDDSQFHRNFILCAGLVLYPVFLREIRELHARARVSLHQIVTIDADAYRLNIPLFAKKKRL